MKTCCRCKEVLPLTEYNRDSGQKDGMQARCKECHRETSLLWKTSDKGRAAGLRYARSERGREMKRLRRQSKKQQTERKLTNV